VYLVLSREDYKKGQAEDPEEYESTVIEEDSEMLVNRAIAHSRQLIFTPEDLAELQAERSNPPAPDSSDDEAPASTLAA
jgi:hypothetical protein